MSSSLASRAGRLSLVALLCGFSSVALGAHPVFDLVANRTLSHGMRAGGLVIAAGSPGFARYIHFSRPLTTWKINRKLDGKRVALAQAQAVLVVPLTGEQTRESLTLHLSSPTRQTVRAQAAGKSSAAVPLKEGWQTVTVALPSGSLTGGENRIVLTFAVPGKIGGEKAAAAVEWIQVGGTSPDAPPTEPSEKGLPLVGGGGLAYYVMVPAGGALEATTQPNGCTVHARARTRERVVVDSTLGAGSATVDLSQLAGHVVRLELTADGSGCTQALVERAALTTSGDAPSEHAVKRPRNVIFWMSDDTRADRFDLYNPKTRVKTPTVDALAKTSTLFKVAYVQGNESRVSHASLWTSLYPGEHHFISEKAKLDPRFVTLAEAIRPSGLYTEGLMANGFIDAFWGFAQGWDTLHNFLHEGGGLKAEDLVRAAGKFLVERAQKPFFLYLGTIDAHVSWRAHAPWIDEYDPGKYVGPFLKACLGPQLEKIVTGKMHLGERDKQRIIALYDSDVSYNDQQLGVLLKDLQASGQADDTMVIYTADHGEELWDHGKIGHGQSLHEELVHVPLLIHYPPLFPPGKVVHEGVEILDLLPTIDDVLGVKPPAEAQGESLLPLAQGVGAGYPRPAIASQYELAHTMRLDRWKLWVGGSGKTEFFDALHDPGEKHELSAERPYERRFVADALGLWMAYQSKWKKSRWGVASNQKPEMPRDLERE